jgi:type VI secretion system protein ImpI/type VI secretion system protein
MATLTLTVLRCPESVTAEQRHVQGGALTVGRGTECDWPLADPLKSLSRKHCTLEFVGGCWQVRDLSTNGTFVNFSTAPIGRDQAQQLIDGDRLRLGAYEIEVAISQATFMPSGPSDLDPLQSPFALPPAGGPHPGFAAARLPGLDDPLPRSEASPFGGRPDPQPAMRDHAASAADAFVPPAAAAPGKPIIPDDWYHDLLPPPPEAAPRAPVAPMVSPFDELLAPLPAPAPVPVPPPIPAAIPRVAPPSPMPPVADDWDHPTHPPTVPARAPVAEMPAAFAAPAVAPAPASASASVPAPVASSALTALLAGADLPPEMAARAAADPEAALRMAGALLRASVAGVRALLIARGTVKREFRIEQTMLRVADNNPLKFAASDEQALAALIDPRSPALWAMRESIDDLTLHQVAALAATQAAAKALLEKLAPAELEAEEPAGGGLFSGGREKKLWEAYKRRHAKLLEQFEDDFESAFGTAFARAYEQAAERAQK